MKKVFLFCLLLLLPTTIMAETLNIFVSKVSANLYQQVGGADRYIKTTSCSEDANNDTATLTMNGTTGTIQIDSGTTCNVTGAYTNLYHSDREYLTTLSYDTDNWYRYDNTSTLRLRTNSCQVTGSAESARVVLSNNSLVHFDDQSCSVEGVYGQETFTTEAIGNIVLYYPHVDTRGDWETEICLINTDTAETLTGNLRAYNNSGALVSDSIPISLAPHARREISVSAEFSDSDTIGYIVFESDDSHVTGYTKFYISGTYRVAVPSVAEVNDDQIYISHIASNNEWWTGLSLVNSTNAEKTITINFDNGETKFVTIPAHGHEAKLISQLFEEVPQPSINSAIVTNASGIVGLELFGGNSLLSGILLRSETASSLYYPHIASDDQWWTGLVAYNPNFSDIQITITPYSGSGEALSLTSSEPIIIESKDKYVGFIQNLGFPTGTAWLAIDAHEPITEENDASSVADKPITGFELFGTKGPTGDYDGTQLAGYTGVNINKTEGTFPKLEPSGWTGIAFVNISNQTATVTLTAYDDLGNSVATKNLEVLSHAKEVRYATDFFTGEDIGDATYIKFSSDQEIVGFQLNGSDDDMLLDGLPGM